MGRYANTPNKIVFQWRSLSAINTECLRHLKTVLSSWFAELPVLQFGKRFQTLFEICFSLLDAVNGLYNCS